MAVFNEKLHQQLHGLSLVDIHLVTVRAVQLTRNQNRRRVCHSVDVFHIAGIGYQLIHFSADLDNSIHPLPRKLFQIGNLHLVAPQGIAQ